VDSDFVAWIDDIEGRGAHSIRGYIPLHPGVRAEGSGDRTRLVTPGGLRLALSIEGAAISHAEGSYAPEFGVRRKRTVLMWERTGRLPVRVGVRLERER
jgi:hypothetical protein